MKKVFLFALLTVTFLSVKAQNFQTHYDFGEDRQMITTTVEMFKPDKYGSTFFFVDFDYGQQSADVDGVSLAYFEIARHLKFWEGSFELHAEYNGGMFRTSDFAAPINNAYLFGGAYTINNEDFTRVFTIEALYKYIDKKHDASFQITAIWGLHFMDRKISFMGFADFWREDNVVFDDDGNLSNTDYVFLTEPQLWYNFNKHLSAGSEIEISSNFGGNKGFMVNPTLALKWNF